jgi:hypothetical protein
MSLEIFLSEVSFCFLTSYLKEEGKGLVQRMVCYWSQEVWNVQ